MSACVRARAYDPTTALDNIDTHTLLWRLNDL
jgi:hypothetical protein